MSVEYKMITTSCIELSLYSYGKLKSSKSLKIVKLTQTFVRQRDRQTNWRICRIQFGKTLFFSLVFTYAITLYLFSFSYKFNQLFKWSSSPKIHYWSRIGEHILYAFDVFVVLIAIQQSIFPHSCFSSEIQFC